MNPPDKSGLSRMHCPPRTVLLSRGICPLDPMCNQGRLGQRCHMLNGMLILLLLSMRPRQVTASKQRWKQDRSHFQPPAMNRLFLILPPLCRDHHHIKLRSHYSKAGRPPLPLTQCHSHPVGRLRQHRFALFRGQRTHRETPRAANESCGSALLLLAYVS